MDKDILSIIISDSFQKELKEAIKYGIDEDYTFDGEDEYPIITYDDISALMQVMEVLKKYLL